jgi:hypothetical protein
MTVCEYVRARLECKGTERRAVERSKNAGKAPSQTERATATHIVGNELDYNESVYYEDTATKLCY